MTDSRPSNVPATDGDVVRDAPTYVIQLRAVRTYEVEAKRFRRESAEPVDPSAEPTVNAQLRSKWISPERDRFRVMWQAEVDYPYSRQFKVKMLCSVDAAFSSSAPITKRRFESFQEREAFVLIWPYLRASMAEMARMLEIRMPPLPVLDVRKVVGPRRRPHHVDD